MSNIKGLIRQTFIMKFNELFSYRFSFFMRLIASAFNGLIQPLLLFFIYNASNGFPGWSFFDIIVFEGTSIFSFGIASFFLFSMVWYVGWNVDNGHFDFFMIRPIGIIKQMIITSINIYAIPDIIIGVIIICVAVNMGGLIISWFNFISWLYLVIISSLIMFFIASLVIALSFRFFKSYNLLDLFWVSFHQFDKYPISIYHRSIGFIMTFVVPVAITSYYPASFLLGKITDLSFLLILSFVCFVFGFAGIIAIRLGVKYYSSAGG